MAISETLSLELIRRFSLHISLAAAFAAGLFLSPTPEHPSDALHRLRWGDDDTYAHFTPFIFDILASSIRCTNPQISPTCIEVVPFFPTCTEYQQNIVF